MAVAAAPLLPRPFAPPAPLTRRPWPSRAPAAGGPPAAPAALAGGIGTLQPAPVSSAPVAEPAPDALAVHADGVTGGAATVSFSRRRGEVVVVAEALPALDAGHAYQAWLIGPRGAQSAGLLHSGSGSVTAALPADVDRIGITTEPAAGSPQPTTPAVVRVPLT